MSERSAGEDFDHETWPAFEPGWPAIYPSGCVSARLISQPLQAEHEPGVSWTIRGGLALENAPRVAFVGELSVVTDEVFSGHTVIMPVFFRDEPDVIDHDYVDAQLEQYARWVSPMLYDFTAQGLRAMLSGYMSSGGSGVGVPNLTPDPQVVLFRDLLEDEGSSEDTASDTSSDP